MSVSVASFLIEFPEYERAPTTLIQAKLDQADTTIDGNVWGEYEDRGILYLAAHLLALSPYGQQARLVAKDGSTTYETEYKRLQRIVTSGYRVI